LINGWIIVDHHKGDINNYWQEPLHCAKLAKRFFPLLHAQKRFFPKSGKNLEKVEKNN
jgi:hypothetical protein